MEKNNPLVQEIKNLTLAIYQVYGELNRIRLIMGENSERAKKIEDFDKKVNYYAPFCDSEKAIKRYTKKNNDIVLGKAKRPNGN